MTALINLNQELAIIEVSGADASTFLQGQLTNDITKIPRPGYQLSAHLNNKGRMLASFIIMQPQENVYYLITTKEIIDTIIPRLKMFVLRAKVTITERSEDTDLDNLLQAAIKGEDDKTNNLPQLISSNDVQTWKTFLITHGIPFIYKNTQELFIPQHLNYDLLDGVSFKKGCYTGQEIVARTHYLGKVKQRMYQFTSPHPIQIGQEVISPKFGNQSIGNIVDTVLDTHGLSIGLVSLRTDCTDSAFIDQDNTQQLTLLTPLFSF